MTRPGAPSAGSCIILHCGRAEAAAAQRDRSAGWGLWKSVQNEKKTPGFMIWLDKTGKERCCAVS